MHKTTTTPAVRILLIVTIVSLHAGFQFIACAEDSPASSPLLPQLRELQPLPKVHYSWPPPFETISDDVLFEFVRITHTVNLVGEAHGEKEIERAVQICKRVNSKHPKIAASIGIHFDVWHRRFGKELPPTDTGASHQAEIDYLKKRMTTIRDMLVKFNHEQETDISVSCVLFDSERFRVRPDDRQWNDAITAKYNAAFDTVRNVFPKVRVEWYGRGGIRPGASRTGWSSADRFTLDEKGESFAVSLYRVPEIETTREMFRRTVRNAAKHGCLEVTPWIALASGYRRQPDKFDEWSYDWNYDLIYSWQLGAEINVPWYGERPEKFAPWNKAKVVVLYPQPFGQTRHWSRHFVAYVRGAHLIKSLPDDNLTHTGKQSK